jgi:hypothetical protein
MYKSDAVNGDVPTVARMPSVPNMFFLVFIDSVLTVQSEKLSSKRIGNKCNFIHTPVDFIYEYFKKSSL